MDWLSGVIGPKQYSNYSDMNRGKLITSGITKKQAKKYKK
jgi:hypothetical protein